MINKLILTGNVAKDPETKKINGKDFITFDIGVWKSKTETQWVRVKAWEKTAQLMSELRKGDRVLVDGRLDIETWDGQDGKKVSKTTILANGYERILKKDRNPDSDTFGLNPEDEF